MLRIVKNKVNTEALGLNNPRTVSMPSDVFEEYTTDEEPTPTPTPEPYTGGVKLDELGNLVISANTRFFKGDGDTDIIYQLGEDIELGRLDFLSMEEWNPTVLREYEDGWTLTVCINDGLSELVTGTYFIRIDENSFYENRCAFWISQSDYGNNLASFDYDASTGIISNIVNVDPPPTDKLLQFFQSPNYNNAEEIEAFIDLSSVEIYETQTVELMYMGNWVDDTHRGMWKNANGERREMITVTPSTTSITRTMYYTAGTNSNYSYRPYLSVRIYVVGSPTIYVFGEGDTSE